MDEVVDVHVTMRWAVAGTVASEDQGKLTFPRLLQQPGVYRIDVTEPSGSTAIYIGEADDLRRRFAHYRNPGPTQRTNLRINGLITQVLAAGGTVELRTATEGRLHTPRGEGPLDLSTKVGRRLAENAALLQATIAGHHRIENL